MAENARKARNSQVNKVLQKEGFVIPKKPVR